MCWPHPIWATTKARRSRRHAARPHRARKPDPPVGKSALNRWVRSAATSASLAGHGNVLNAVAPGAVATEIVKRTWERKRVLLETALPQPFGIPGPVAPVADLLAYAVYPATGP